MRCAGARVTGAASCCDGAVRMGVAGTGAPEAAGAGTAGAGTCCVMGAGASGGAIMRL